MIKPVFGALSPRSAARQPIPVGPAIPQQPQPNGNPVLNNQAAIPGILEGIQQIMQQRRAQNQNAVRFGMDAQPPEDPNPPGLPGHANDDPPGTPEGQGIPLVVPNAPRAPQLNRVRQQADAAAENAQPQLPHLPPINLLPIFNQLAQFNNQPQPAAPQPQPQPPQSPSVQSAQTLANIQSPTHSVTSKKENNYR